MVEPQIHSHHTDELPDDNPLAYVTVYCKRCGVMVHAGNNECMQTWIELPDHLGNYCLPCFAIIDDGEGPGGLSRGRTREKFWEWTPPRSSRCVGCQRWLAENPAARVPA